MFFSQYFSFSCQYNSTNAPYSFIHSSTTHAVQYFSPITSVSPVSIIPPMFHIHSFIHSFNLLPPSLYNVFLPVLHFPLSVSFHQCSMLIHSFIYHQRSIMFISQHFRFPCQYHSTNAPYSFIHSFI